MIKKILIANRGEIAVRIQKACRNLGITSAAIFSDDDEDSLHVRLADEAYNIGASRADQSYLNQDKIINLAKEINADAIHPGYGFFSENAEFIKKVEENNIVFIGPSARSVELMGEKTSARRIMIENDVPIVPGSTKHISDFEDAKQVAKEIGYPIMLKAASGGGGKGMRMVESEDDLENSINRAMSEAKKAFGDESVYIEKFIENPKHIEVQIIADKHGNYVHLFERECSVQRRNQKVIEESPSPSINEDLRNRITASAIQAAKACKYYNAGTIEFLLDRDGNYYFLEMNTRLQVEHPVTEMITGIDLVEEQINIANNAELSFSQKDVCIHGHAVEARIYAEDAENNFAPSIGTITHHRLPSGPGIRIDRGIEKNSKVSLYYDPMLSKVIAWGKNREIAIKKLTEAISNYQITGVKTNIPFCKWILSHKIFLNSTFSINFIRDYFNDNNFNEWINYHNADKNASIILATILKHELGKLNPAHIELSEKNKWTEN